MAREENELLYVAYLLEKKSKADGSEEKLTNIQSCKVSVLLLDHTGTVERIRSSGFCARTKSANQVARFRSHDRYGCSVNKKRVNFTKVGFCARTKSANQVARFRSHDRYGCSVNKKRVNFTKAGFCARTKSANQIARFQSHDRYGCSVALKWCQEKQSKGIETSPFSKSSATAGV